MHYSEVALMSDSVVHFIKPKRTCVYFIIYKRIIAIIYLTLIFIK